MSDTTLGDVELTVAVVWLVVYLCVACGRLYGVKKALPYAFLSASCFIGQAWARQPMPILSRTLLLLGNCLGLVAFTVVMFFWMESQRKRRKRALEPTT